MNNLKDLLAALRRHPLTSGAVGTILLAVIAALIVLSVTQPWSGDAAADFTSGNLEAGTVSGYLHRPVDQPSIDFSLTNQHGSPVSLSDFRGKTVIVDWIYTSCMTVCPALTANMKMVQAGLGDRVGGDVQLITVTFDPDRDTVEKMRTYAQAVHADIDGWSWLTGTKGQTDAVSEAYGVTYAPSEPMMGMAMYDHTALTVVIGPNGRETDRYFGVGWAQDMLDRLAD